MKLLAALGIFLFPLVIVKSLWYGIIFSKIILIFAIIEFILFLFLAYSLDKEEISLKKSPAFLALCGYVIIMIVSAIWGEDFNYSFWSSFSRSTGIITWLHYLVFSFILANIFSQEKDWKIIFRSLAVSSFIVALGSFIGNDGLSLVNSFPNGGSFFHNTSYSAAYLLLAFFLILVGLKIEDHRKWRVFYIISMVTIFFNPDLFNFDIFNRSLSIQQALSNPVFLLGMARTSSVILWLGSGTALALFIFHKIKEKRTTVILASSLLLILVVLYSYGFISLVVKKEGPIYEKYVATSGIARPVVWSMALKGIKERPVLGYGLENFTYVYQENLDARLIPLEGGGMFDDVHNYTLSQVVETGVLGATMMFAVFILLTVTSFKFYLKYNRYYYLLIPFIFFLHFLQMQTFFEAYNTLLLALLLFSFLIYREPSVSFKIPVLEYKKFTQIGLAAVFIAGIYFFIYLPIRENSFIYNFLNYPERVSLTGLSHRLENSSIDPVETLGIVSKNFSNFTSRSYQQIEQKKLNQSVLDEFQIYLDAYRRLLPKYQDHYFFLIRYGDFINSSSLFGVGSLQEGEDALKNALQISNGYPQPYLMMAVNLYYQGKIYEALDYAKQAQDISSQLLEAKKVYEMIKAGSNSADKTKKPIIIDLFGS